jgi:hypothetical protein
MRTLAGLMLLALSCTAIHAQPGHVQEGLHLKFGTWKLNLGKSSFPPGTAPQSDTRVYQDGGTGFIQSTHTTINRQGQESVTTYAAKFDGNEYPVTTRGSSAVSSIAFHVIDSYSESFVLMRDGKVATRGTTTVSKDGKTMTMVLNTTDAQGKTLHGVSIYEKQ